MLFCGIFSTRPGLLSGMERPLSPESCSFSSGEGVVVIDTSIEIDVDDGVEDELIVVVDVAGADAALKIRSNMEGLVIRGAVVVSL